MNSRIISKFSLCYPGKTKSRIIAEDLAFTQNQPIAALIKGSAIKFHKMEVQL